MYHIMPNYFNWVYKVDCVPEIHMIPWVIPNFWGIISQEGEKR